MSLVTPKVHFAWLVIANFALLTSANSLATNDIFDDISDSVTARVRARSPKTSRPSIFATDNPIVEVTGPIESFVASTIRSNTRTVTPSSPTTTTTTTTTTSTTTVAPTTTTKPPSMTSKSIRTTTSTTKSTPSRKIATHPPWPGETTVKPRATHAPWNPEELHRPRGPHASKYGSRNRATHAPWPPSSMNAYDTSSGYGYSSSQSEHLFPTKSNYAPYVYGSDAKKKSILSILDRESINNWAKEVISYLTNPFGSSSSSFASSSSSGESSESIIGRVLKSLRAAFNKRSSEERGGGVDEVSNDNLLSKLKNVSWIKRLQSSSVPSLKDSHYKKHEKKFRDLALTALVDFFRFKRHRTHNSSANLKPAVKNSMA